MASLHVANNGNLTVYIPGTGFKYRAGVVEGVTELPAGTIYATKMGTGFALYWVAPDATNGAVLRRYIVGISGHPNSRAINSCELYVRGEHLYARVVLEYPGFTYENEFRITP